MNMKVVIVDDTQVNVMLLRHLVAQLDEKCDSVCFLNPAEGLVWCQENDPDLLVVDYMMPGLDGLEFIRRFRETQGKANIPVLMITANDQIKVRYQALEGGANDFLTKPVDKIEFLVRARNMLALRKGQRQLANRAAWLAEEVRKATAEIVARDRDIIIRLTKTAEFRDPETGDHILRMAAYSRLIAARMGLPETDQELLLETAPMHDVGKVGIPDYILLKPGKLDAAEFEIMKQHARIGREILADSPSKLMQVAAEIAYCHHEKFDGSGYPNGLKGDGIPLFSRIVAVADVFDALTSSRPYKRAWEPEEAMALLKENAGSHFDPACVEAFLSGEEGIMAIRAQFSGGSAAGR